MIPQVLCAVAALSPMGQAVQEPAFWKFAPTPPMGWCSWDCFATTVTEAQTKANADVMADKLKQYGWEYVLVDIQWYEPNPTGFQYRDNAPLTMDEYGRLLPAPNRFPSSEGGKGFKPLADYVHGKGLKFGIHLLRGIPRQAVQKNLPILGTQYHAVDIALTNSTCSWNGDMYGVDVTKPGGQEYYDSVVNLAASWGVDYIKVDDISRPYDAVQKGEIEAIRKAIDKSGRPIVFSLSPGATPLAEADHVEHHANMWRVSDDFWDTWDLLYDQFKFLDEWTPYRAPGHFPDADQLALGAIRLVPGYGGPPHTRFTKDEQFTHVTLWCIARSPLMMAGDMTQMDDFTYALLSNDEVIAVDQHSSGNRQLFHTQDGLIAWIADVDHSTDKYLAVFNTTEKTADVPVNVADLGLGDEVKVRDLWKKQDMGKVKTRFAPLIPSHGAGLYRISASTPRQ